MHLLYYYWIILDTVFAILVRYFDETIIRGDDAITCSDFRSDWPDLIHGVINQ